ncbi:hypothetical protein FD20_GL001223 [Liquorilactobacillus uvarum DSM 19971]|uniref:NlpC/P60 domain-containing protein n=2 Tax=Liquorilactobacillus uvarum TaxID=303240 RepID=A0A0R1Q188_9LACO|nr:hypothetical protein FD20_GL001223 [Liquorilactobacillus uvarum DSM 19971]
MKTSFQRISNQNKTVYYNGSGQMQYGQQYLSRHWYLFDNNTGAMKTGFQHISNQNKTVYYNGSGQIQYGQQYLSRHWYLFDGRSGAMKTNFQRISNQNKTVYYNGSGQMQYGQQYINKHWYLFDSSTGAVQVGFCYIVNQHKVVYYNNSGQMLYGSQAIDGVRYYFKLGTGELTGGKSLAERAIKWFYEREGRITYSMMGSRNGNDGTADCSGSVTQALWTAGLGTPAASARRWGGYNTDSLHSYLTSNGFKLVAENHPINVQRGDVIIWGKKGSSSGGAGHTGIISSPGYMGSANTTAKFISTCYWTNGQRNTAIQDLSYYSYWLYDDKPYYYVYRHA